MYGYPCYLFALTESNIAEVNRLKEIFTKCKEIDKDVAQITFYNHSLDFDVTNENFDVTEKKVVSMTDEDVETYTDTTENSYRVEPSFIRVNEFAIYMVYNSKWTSDEVWGEIGFEELENFNKTLTV